MSERKLASIATTTSSSSAEAERGALVSHADIDMLLTEIRYLREALVLAREIIDPEQHDVIEEIDMALAYKVERVAQRDGSPGALPAGRGASHQDASGRVTLPTEGTPDDAEAPPRSELNGVS